MSTQKCGVCNKEMTLLGIEEEQQQRWYCYRDNELLNVQPRPFTVTDEALTEAKRRFRANLRGHKVSDEKIDKILSKPDSKADTPEKMIQWLAKEEWVYVGPQMGAIVGAQIMGGPIGILVGNIVSEMSRLRNPMPLLGSLLPEEASLLNDLCPVESGNV